MRACGPEHASFHPKDLGAGFHLPGRGRLQPAGARLPVVKTTETRERPLCAFPVGYVEVGEGQFHVEVGSLPTLSARVHIHLENMNANGGLLWVEPLSVAASSSMTPTRISPCRSLE